MKKRIRPLAKSLKTGLVNLAAATGSHCPKSGVWVPQDDVTDSRHITEGSLMPSLDSRPVLWTYKSPVQ